MRAISRPRKTDAIAHHPPPQKKMGQRGPSSKLLPSVRRQRRPPVAPARGLKKKSPSGGFTVKLWGSRPIHCGRGPQGPRILADRSYPVEAEFRGGGGMAGAPREARSGSRPPSRKAVVPRVE